jgi:cytochrome P450
MASRPPGPLGPLRALLSAMRGGGRLPWLKRLTEQYGDVVVFELPGAPPFAVLNHPDYARDVLVTNHRLFHKGVGLERAKMLLGEGLLTSEEALHARQRRLLLPAFHRERIAAYASTMAEYARRRSAAWTGGATLDVAQEMAALTLAIAGKTLFDADVERDAATIGEALTTSLDAFNLVLMPFGDRLVNAPIPPAIRFKRAKGRLDEIVYRLIAERRASGRVGADVLSMLVAAQDAEGDRTGMTDRQVRDEAITLLLAGHETTANALTWTWYLLSSHPEAEQRLHVEIDAELGGRPAGADDVRRLAYTHAVIAESMRLYPPAYLVGRRAIVPYHVPGTDYVLPAGTTVLISQYFLHRDARFWSDPERFVPERWLAEGIRAETLQYAYFPFGAGPRICIGEHFAWMELTIVLATIAQRWRLRVAPDQKVALQPIITLRPKYGMRMSVEPRMGAAHRGEAAHHDRRALS